MRPPRTILSPTTEEKWHTHAEGVLMAAFKGCFVFARFLKKVILENCLALAEEQKHKMIAKCAKNRLKPPLKID